MSGFFLRNYCILKVQLLFENKLFFQEGTWDGQWEDTQSVTITESQPSNLRKCRSWIENSFRAGCSLKCRLDTVLSWAWWLNVLICLVFVFVFGLSSSPGSAEVGVSRAWWSSKVRAPLLINLLLLLLLFSTTPSKSLHSETFFPQTKCLSLQRSWSSNTSLFDARSKGFSFFTLVYTYNTSYRHLCKNYIV